MFFTYGRRNNQHLLINYSFSYSDNAYEQINMYMRMGVKLKDPESMIETDMEKCEDIQKIGLKYDQLNQILQAYLRYSNFSIYQKPRPMIKKPLAIRTELKIMNAYKDICIHFLKTQLEKETTLEQDHAMLDGLTLDDGFSYSMRFAVVFRAERKKIVHN